jgi:hypothetical protein
MTTLEANTTPATQDPNPKPKRTRGPNKPKVPDAAITVKIEAVISQADIIKLLTIHVVKMLDKETAAKMELQFNLDGKGWVADYPDLPRASLPKIRFATKEAR